MSSTWEPSCQISGVALKHHLLKTGLFTGHMEYDHFFSQLLANVFVTVLLVETDMK